MPLHVRVLVILLLVGFAAGDAAGVRADETVSGPLGSVLTSGHSGSWTVSVAAGQIVLANPDDAGAIRYYAVPWQGDRVAGRAASVRVTASAGAKSGAGLLAQVGPQRKTYLALLLDGGHRVALYQRDAAGLRRLGEMPLAAPDPDGDTLQVVQHGQSLSFLANGVRLPMTVPAPAGELLDEVGIVAVGSGRFTVRDFAFGPAPADASQANGNDDRVPEASSTPAPPTPVPPPPPVPPELLQQTRSFLGGVVGIVAHEFGHYMVGELALNATGPEEDVADEFASMLFIMNIRLAPDNAEFRDLTLGFPKFWRYMAEDRERRGSNTPWWDEHAPDMVRYGKAICLFYGGDPEHFKQLMDDAKVPESRRASCIEEAARKQKTWNALLRPHRRRDADPDFPGDLPADAPGGKVTVEYGPMNSAFARVMGPVLKQAHLFENLAGIATKLYVLPRDTKIIVRDCDEANCWYSEDDGSVTICYSMMKLVLDLVHQHEGGQTGAPPPPVATPTPKPKPAPQSVDLPHFLTGTWFSQTTNALGFAETRAMLNADGTYLAQESIRMSSGGFVVITARGRWSAQPMGGNRFTMTQVPFEWTPRQICQAPGYCQPLTLGRVTEVITIVDRNTMRTQAGQINRVTPPEE